MRKHEALEAICDELQARAVPFTIALGRHYKVRFEVAGRRHMITVPCSASDYRIVANTRALLRRLFRA
jgi:hypothetical protein